MSQWVVRGEPTLAQRYLDKVLARARRARPSADKDISMPQLLFFCLKESPDAVFMINGATGEVVSNGAMLARAVRLARALAARGGRGAAALAAVRDHQHTVALYFAMLFAGLVPMLVDPVATQFELEHFMRLVEPRMVFCESAARAHTAAAAAAACAPHTPLYDVDTDDLAQLAAGYSDDVHTFQVPDADPDDILLTLPTSGSTGMPKAAQLTHHGVLVQTPSSWAYHSQFPCPTEQIMILTTPQWVTFTMMITTCTVYQVPLLMSPKQATVEHVLEMILKYRPTWTFFGPAFGKGLAKEATPDHFSSLETIFTLGSQATPDIIDAIQEKMQPGRRVSNGYGMTETHGFICITDPDAPTYSNGKVDNILHYKLIKENGEEAVTDEEGELLVKGSCIIKGYVKNPTELSESMTSDGWLRTGDEFRRQPAQRLAYSRRIKFSFKFRNQLVSPEELEGVVGSVAGVAQSVVVEHERGPAAAVVLATGADPQAVLRQIHSAVEGKLSDHKRLRGGVAFVECHELPRTHSGKLHRGRARELFARLYTEGRCC